MDEFPLSTDYLLYHYNYRMGRWTVLSRAPNPNRNALLYHKTLLMAIHFESRLAQRIRIYAHPNNKQMLVPTFIDAPIISC